MIPGTATVYDREKLNFCEEFSPSEAKKEIALDISQAAKKLFGDEEGLAKKQSPEERFKSLFD